MRLSLSYMIFLFCIVVFVGPAYSMSSANYKVSTLLEIHGSGYRSSTNYQIVSDAISSQPVETSTSTNYILKGSIVLYQNASRPFCGVYINSNDVRTGTTSVTLSLICGSSDGCAEVSISNNGVAWSTPEPYSTSKPWTLADNDGERMVFVKYKSTTGEWSGVCHDSIILDRTAPQVTASPVGGTYMNSPQVTLTSSEPATIYYTTDGTDPTTSSTVYTGPITLTGDTTLKAFAVDSAGNAGPIMTETYEVCTGNNLSISGVVRDATLNRVDNGMPLVTITLDSGYTTITNPDGSYFFTGLPRGYYKIVSVTTAKPGYVTYQKELKLCKSSINHDIVLTRDATVFGTNTNSGYSADSVNTATGNFVYKVADLAIPGRGMSFNFERTYNSQDAKDGTLGFGWTHNYNISLSEESGGEIVVRWGDGRVEVWTPDGSGGYSPMYGVYSTMTKNSDGTFTLKQKDMIEYHFNSSGQMVSIVDEYANAITFNYTGSNLTEIIDTVGRVITLTYDTSGRITSILDPIGRSVTFSYDVNGNLVSSTNLEGNASNYTYDSNHQMLTVTDPKGNVVLTNVYDDQRRVVASQRDALGGETLYTYDVQTRTTKIIDPLGNITYHHFDDHLRLIQEDDARGYSAHYIYDERGNLVSVTDKRGNVTTYEYDLNGNIIRKTEPLGRVTTATYDSNNNPLTKTDANGNKMAYEYDPVHGNLLTVWECGQLPVVDCKTDPQVSKTTYSYDQYGQLLTVTDALGNTTIYEYDVYGNRVAVIDALGNRSTFTYDAVGRKQTENHPLGRSTAYAYDKMDRLISVTDALGGTSLYVYDENGNKIEHIDANGNKTIFTYDAKDRLISKTTPLGETEEYIYDSLDRRVAIISAKGDVASVVYDALGNVIQEVDAHGNTIRHEYDPNGNKIKTIDPLGNITTYKYDALNRLVETTDPLGNKTTYTYDLNGNRLSVTDALGNSITYTYDHMNRLTSISEHFKDGTTNTTTNIYDELGRLIRVIDAEGRQTDYEYDALGRLVKVTDAAGGMVTAT